MAKSENYKKAYENARMQGAENCKAILILHNKESIKKAFPLMNDFQKELKLAQRTCNLFEGYSNLNIYKEYAVTFEIIEWTEQRILQSKLTTMDSLGILNKNDVKYSSALMG